MLSRLIVNSYEAIIEILMWLSLAGFVIGGIVAGQNIPLYYFGINAGPTESSILYAVAGFLMWIIFSVFFMGVLLILSDIRKRVKNIETQKK